MNRTDRQDRAYLLWTAHRFMVRAQASFRAGFLRVADYYAIRARNILRPMTCSRSLRLWQDTGYVLVRCSDWLRGAS